MDDLIRLCAGRWLMPVMALANARGALRPAEAAAQLGIARGVARASFDALLVAGWLVPHPSHGQARCPDYRLSFTGIEIARLSAELMAARDALALTPQAITRWTVPLLAALDGERRFGELAPRLSPISPRALSLTIKQALAEQLIVRRLVDGFPPVPLYARTDHGELLAAALEDATD